MFVKEIEVSELKSRLGEGANIRLLDIRSDAEVAGGMLPSSEHLAMHLIPLKMQEFSADPAKEVVLYCRSAPAPTMPACI